MTETTFNLHNINFNEGKDGEVYRDFYDETDGSDFEQIHVHLQSLKSDKVKKYFCKPTYKVEVTAIDSTTNHSPLGKFDKFPRKKHYEPTWDSKCMVLGKKVEAIEFKIISKRKIPLLSSTVATFIVNLDRSRFENDGDWTEPNKDKDNMKINGFTLNCRIRIATKRIVSKEDFDRMFPENTNPNEAVTCKDQNLSYEEQILKEESSNDSSDWALLQSFKHRAASKAILWIPGRNDGFMHPHVYYRLLNESKYDLYVLNYRSTAQCLNKGWVTDPEFSSHNKEGDFDVYIPEIEGAIHHMTNSDGMPYDTKLGYAHSTGGPVLINYLMNKGDENFDGFIFNSPFLKFGTSNEGYYANIISLLTGNMIRFPKLMSKDRKLIIPEIASTGIGKYLTSSPGRIFPSKNKLPFTYAPSLKDGEEGKRLQLTKWTAKIYAQYYFKTGVRPIYKVPQTAGFITGVERVHTKIQDRLKNDNPITSKPFVLLASRSDDVLNIEGMRTLIDSVGTARMEIELRDNAHDIFLSLDERDTNVAIDFIKGWMERYGFL